MSTADKGESRVAETFLDQAKELLEAAAAEEAQQLDMLAPPTAEEMVEARELLGPEAGRLAVVREARRGRGRPPGARNKRGDDFARYLLSFGQHPAITMMQIQATSPEVLIEASKQEKVHSFRADGTPNTVIERLTYGEAQSLRIRCSEALMPFLESKKPIGIDMNVRGITVVDEIGSRDAANDPVDGGVLGVLPPPDDGDVEAVE